MRQFELDYQQAREKALADEDTRQLVSWKVQSEVIKETAALRRSMKCVLLPPSRAREGSLLLTLLSDDLLHHLMSSYLEVARLLFATSRQFRAVASAVLHELVPRFLLTGPLKPQWQCFLGKFAQRHQLINGRPSYLSIRPDSKVVVYYCRVACRWCVGRLGATFWPPLLPHGPPEAYAYMRDPRYVDGRDPEDAQQRVLIHILRDFKLGRSVEVDAAGYALAPHPVAFHLSASVALLCEAWEGAFARSLGQFIRCLRADDLAAEREAAPALVFLSGSSDRAERQLALGSFTKLDEGLYGYPVYQNAHGYRMWHEHNRWVVGSWELGEDDPLQVDGQGLRISFCVLLHSSEESLFDPSATRSTEWAWRAERAQDSFDSEKQRIFGTENPLLKEPKIRCFSESYLRLLLRGATRSAAPILALVGNTPDDAHCALLGKYVKAGADGNGYVYYVNARDPTMVLWRHEFAWTVGHRDQLRAGEWGHFAVVDSALQPEDISGVWQMLSAAHVPHDAPDLQIFLPAKRARESHPMLTPYGDPLWWDF